MYMHLLPTFFIQKRRENSNRIKLWISWFVRSNVKLVPLYFDFLFCNLLQQLEPRYLWLKPRYFNIKTSPWLVSYSSFKSLHSKKASKNEVLDHSRWFSSGGVAPSNGAPKTTFNQFDLFWTTLIHFDQVWTSLIPFEHVWTSLINLDQV